MKKILFTTVILFSFITLVQAQITLKPTFSNVCRGAIMELPFTSTGSFDPDNTFKVQIKGTYDNSWTDLVTSGTASPLKFTIQDSFAVDQYSNYSIRIISSKPQITSDTYFISQVLNKPLVNLAGIFDPVVNPNSPAGLLINGSGTLPIKVVLDDSSSINIDYFEYGKAFPAYPTASKEYKIVYAENVCGRSTASGSAKVTVNEIGLLPILNFDEKICIGGKLKLSYSANNSFNQDNKFKIILKQLWSEKKEYELDAIDRGGFLEATIPDYITTGMKYEARISSTSPKAISPSTGNQYTIIIGAAPSAEILSSNSTITSGERVTLNIGLKGVGPWNVILSNGIQLKYSPLNYNSNDYTINTDITPSRSLEIKVSSVTSACGVGTSGSKGVNITVLNSPNIVINPVKQESLSVCLGQTFEATYSTFGDWGNDESLSAFLSIGAGESYPKITVPATFKEGKLKITIPKDLLDKIYTKDFYLGIISKNEKIAYSPFILYVNSFPEVSFFNETSTITIPSSSEVKLPISIRGVGTTIVTLDDSSSYAFHSEFNGINKVYFPLKVNETTTFKIASYSNFCGKGISTDNRWVNVIITTPPTNGLILKAFPQRICVGANAKVYFKTTGNFTSDNDFKVELTSFQNNIPIVLGTAKTSPIDIKIPENLVIEDNNFYFIRVVATKPTISTETQRIIINKKPSGKLSILTDDYTKGILPSTELTFNIESSGGLSASNIFTFSDGSTATGNQFIRKIFSKSNTFSLVSVKNECGINTDAKNSFEINVFPYITNHNINFTREECLDKLISYSYDVEGEMKSGTTFTLQIASAKDSIFRDAVVDTPDNPIKFKFPSGLKDGYYFVRLVNKATKYNSAWQWFNLYSPAVIELLTKDGSNTVTTDGENSTDLIYKIKEGAWGTFITSDNYNQTFAKTFLFPFDKDEIIQKVNPTKSITYTLKSVSSSICGYGKVSGSVKITVKPSVKLNSLESYTLCPEKDILLNYSTFGEFANDNIFKFSLVDDKNNKIEIGQINKLQGTLKLKMPKTFASSTYKMEVSSTNPVTSKELVSYLGVSNLPDVTLSGNTIINQGQVTYINLINNEAIPDISSNLDFTLSDNIARSIYTPNKKASIFVSPYETTTYTLKSVSNICGLGKISGSATVTVNPASDKTISTSLPSNVRYLCLGATQELTFTYQGSFTANNKFSVQISDKNGDNYKTVTSEGNGSPLKFKVPEDLPIGDNYRVRVIASDPNVSSASNIYPLGLRTISTAELDSTTYLFKEGKPVNLKINLTGTPPWYVKFGSDELLTSYSQAIYSSPYIRTITPTMPTSYKIFAISDAYCPGKVLGTGIAKIELVTANEDPRDLNITLFPNPTPDFVTIRSDYFKNTKLKIIDSLGKDISEQDLVKSETVLDFTNFTTGVYFLQFNRDNKRVVYKIQKL
ncbi:T9SS type A sorting domain-containing protein [Arcicella sp. DC2W]|uniref:T9SS type A sorting domain-containing protein n=1 Tax=Arcicella gelida TaxID=2984195 RepID=A0ABU5SAD9_9BACT|nr:T9SS type A sorting domain-containing protein [Arcicella sp. DC2W]MEA5405445.1 T9SS type A sorting domain-containing protein [Arcicella sp. DC2W]